MDYFDLEDDYALPMTGKVSPTACLGGRTVRPLCSCCGGSNGVRRALRKVSKFDADSTPHWARTSKGAKSKSKYRR